MKTFVQKLLQSDEKNAKLHTQKQCKQSNKNASHGRHQISRPMRIGAQISIKYAFCIKRKKKRIWINLIVWKLYIMKGLNNANF